jgi:DNA-binding MarR family transcriptional regulator
MDVESQRDLSVLEAIAADRRITQRRLATELGLALGLTNLYVKRLIKKGYIKCVNVRSNRILYLITPRGVAQKARLTYEFMEHSVHLYRQMRAHLRTAIAALPPDSPKVAIFGTGEAAELAYLSLRESGLEAAAIFDRKGEVAAKPFFLGLAVRDIAEHSTITYDVMIVATMGLPDALMAALLTCGVPTAKLVTLRPPSGRGPDGKPPRNKKS